MKRLNHAYDTLHLAGYYHSTKSSKTIKDGLDEAASIIEVIAPPIA
ncbi:MAG: DUF5618 family protein [Bernardetiaceae bacterium]|nr:DUF5618 family protein [Bernardetiaceae bacterium]